MLAQQPKSSAPQGAAEIAVQALLRGISPSSKVNGDNWQVYMAKRMRLYYELDPADNPFIAADQEEEAEVYAALTAQQRCAFCSNPRTLVPFHIHLTLCSMGRTFLLFICSNPRLPVCSCVMLRALCDLRADKEDMRALIELSQMSEKAQLKALSTSMVQASNEDVYEPVRTSEHAFSRSLP